MIVFLYDQMGSQFKAAALEEHTAKAIRQWHKDVKQKRKKNNHHHDLDSSQHQEGSSHSVAERQSSTVFESSSRTLSSQEMSSSHHRAPTFSEINSLGIECNEIVELTETVVKDEPVVSGKSMGIKIGEISEIHEGETLTAQTERQIS